MGIKLTHIIHMQSRLRYGFVFVTVIFSSLWIWALIIQHEFTAHRPVALDWTSPGFGRAFGLYIMLNTCGNMVQNYLYFLIGTIGEGTSELSRSAGLLRGIESWGQCVAFGINSSKFSLFYTVVIDCVFWFVSLIPAAYTVWQVQGRPEYAAAGEDNQVTKEEKEAGARGEGDRFPSTSTTTSDTAGGLDEEAARDKV